MNTLPPKGTDSPQESTNDRETAPDTSSGAEGQEGSESPPKPEHEPTATEDHARALEARVAELEAELAGHRQADALRTLKARHAGIPGHVIDRMAETVPTDALEATVRAAAEAMGSSQRGSTGGGGLGGSSETKPGGFAGLFRSRDRGSQARPFTI